MTAPGEGGGGPAEGTGGEGSGPPPASAAWHATSPEEVLRELGSEPGGLSPDEARRRLEEHGPNEIAGEDGVSPFRILLSQFRDFLIYLLLLAAALSVAVGFLPGSEPRWADAVLIVLILLANGLFGFAQDYRAERAIEALKELATPDATVVRDGRKRGVDAREVVPGDILVLRQGDRIPADARLLEAHSLETDEASLTGESGGVPKDPGAVDAAAPLARRSGMVYMGTAAVRGRGRAVVVATGMETRVGGIASRIREADDGTTPFQEEVDRLGKRIGAGILCLIGVVAAVQLLFTEADPISILLVSVTLAVAAVPEGLPAVVTLTLALGSRRMLRQHALVRRLPVVESLGSVDVIATDKTGTLTENRMTVVRILSRDGVYEVVGGDEGGGTGFRREGWEADPRELDPVLRCGAVCNDAEEVEETSDSGKGEGPGGPAGAGPSRGDADEGGGPGGRGYAGDPTEVALLAVAAAAGIRPETGRIREIPFSSDRKRMTVVSDESPPVAYVKGAPEVVLERCDRVLGEEGVRELDADHREALLRRSGELAGEAYRVIACARREVEDPEAPEDALESGLVFLGLQAMIDPPREEVPGAVEDCRRAGIRVIMVTGDAPETARAIGEEVGFDPRGTTTGPEVDALSDGELAERVEGCEIFARVSPEHKVRLLRALRENGHRVAMTGDGVNDAPALRSADVGIAMGIRGTGVAKEASDMVLRDDNFVTIRNAVAEGRGIFDNIRKFVGFLLSANAGEVLTVFAGVLLGSALFPERFAGRSEALILTPVMLLWINLVTDGLPALALGVDPKAEEILSRPPRGREEPLLDGVTLATVAGMGLAMTVVGLVLFFREVAASGDLVLAQTLLFTFIVVIEMAIIQAIRSRYHLSPTSNGWLLAAVASSVLLQLVVLYTPLAGFFGVRTPGVGGWIGIGVASVVFGLLAWGVSRTAERTAGGR